MVGDGKSAFSRCPASFLLKCGESDQTGKNDSPPIAGAVVAAHRRGVKVTVLLDKSNRREKYSAADFLRNAGVPTFIDSKHAIAHNKVMVIDDATVITGSFNFSKAAEEDNAENLLIIRDARELASKYTANWQHHAKHSELYEGRSPSIPHR
jgi:phosphatidylserine/phosphatidylglycerophosphate/cardiolipin synthase-like enzyme